jgi:hypothetical protein
MLSLPENWDYSINGLVAICKENIKAIRSGLVELETYDYLSRNRIQKADGKFDYEYLIYEKPYSRFGHTVNGYAVTDIPRMGWLTTRRQFSGCPNFVKSTDTI